MTFASRGLESIRGFDLFMKVARRICTARSDVIFVVAGGEEIHYGWDKLHTGAPSFKEWVSRGQDDDLDRFIFTGRVLPEQLASIMRNSDLHIYLTAPFVLSWSLLDAMASGCVVLASDVPPVREVIESGRNGLIEPLFDIDRLTETALRVLDDPAAFAPLGRAARETIVEKYSLEVCIPPPGRLLRVHRLGELARLSQPVASRAVIRENQARAAKFVAADWCETASVWASIHEIPGPMSALPRTSRNVVRPDRGGRELSRMRRGFRAG